MELVQKENNCILRLIQFVLVAETVGNMDIHTSLELVPVLCFSDRLNDRPRRQE